MPSKVELTLGLPLRMDHKETMGFLIPTLAQLVEHLTVEVL